MSRTPPRRRRKPVSEDRMMRAAGEVIAARLALMAEGRADLGEITLMSSEKIEAFSLSAASAARGMEALGEQMIRAPLDELDHASRACAEISASATPAQMATAQMAYMTGFWSRAASNWMALNTRLNETREEALRPIHDTAVANARRLRVKPVR
jgi:hypothetical protein